MLIGQVLLLVVYLVSAKGGGGSGGSKGPSSGGSKGPSSGGSKGPTSGSGSSGNRPSNSGSKNPSGSSGGVWGTKGSATSLGYKTVNGYPSNSFFAGYGFSSLYMYYLLSSSRSPYYGQPTTNRKTSDCVAFNTLEGTEASIIISPSISQSEIDSGSIKQSVPHVVNDTINFYGNLTLNYVNIQVSFEATNIDYGTRLGNVQSLNSSLASGGNIDVLGSQLFTSLWSSSPMIQMKSLEFQTNYSVMNGSMFSYSDLSVNSGLFEIYTARFLLQGSITPESIITDSTINLVGVSQIYMVNVSSTSTRLVLSAIQPGSLLFRNANLTALGMMNLNNGTYNFKGANVSIVDCETDVGAVVLIVAAVLVVALTCCCGCCWVFKKQKLVTWNGQMPVYQTQNMNNNIPMTDAFLENQSFLPPVHNIHNASKESFERAIMFLQTYPPGSKAAMDAAIGTSNIPPAMLNSPSKITMMQPRLFSQFGFLGPVHPVVNVGPLEPTSGRQVISFRTNQDCSIQSNVPLLPHRLSNTTGFFPIPPPSFNNSTEVVDECYFEMKIISKLNHDTTIAVGFAGCPYPPFRLPGWNAQSIAYHSDDGAVFINDPDYGQKCGPSARAGDTIGVGYKVVHQLSVNGQPNYQLYFYFTHNQTRLSQEYSEHGFLPHILFPTVGCDGDCEIEMYFGDIHQSFYATTNA
ncbi:hypothetical protein BC833DRAFT_659484 [Globomyces pollinis-pini]|nr:hypothetical protein BC833DRAFT_659484 [Globomyces pollinis-pini]